MSKRGALALTRQEIAEICDLYKWGADMYSIQMLYDVHRRSILKYIKLSGTQVRPNGRPVLLVSKRKWDVKSSRPQIPAGARISSGDDQGVDQLIRSSAHALRDKRTAERQSDVSKRSCPASASESRYAFLRSGNRLPDLE